VDGERDSSWLVDDSFADAAERLLARMPEV
jgi:hypothetical protein